MSKPFTLAAQIHALRTLIEHRERAGPCIYIAAGLATVLRDALRTLEETQNLVMHLERVAINRWGPPLEDEESAA